ncbi:AtpZ/AtpI family protein [Thalassospira mesophila]|uniref:ATPase F0F1 n=1 Tax=Thalassospira mesophila TaxID=1293891 RepID=A0A1Y2KUU8_9PROT|nr:AtpZ/AtpI family protein [Thalassospira mesophila]OSQ35407.1 ATPase F0F1 [Thalassospira mesophila]
MTADHNAQQPPAPAEDDPLVRETRLRRDRRERWQREGDMSIGRRLAQIGVLGWIIVIPTLAGLFAGHWIDARHGTGIFWTGPFLVAGLAVGGWTAWKWMNSR